MLASEVIQRVRQIQIRTGRQVADCLAGEYVSVFRGAGIEFQEVRPYIPGDDVRAIDWNVTARYGAPFIKRYIEQRQLTLMLMVDISASQDFGSNNRSKREAAAELCALLAFSATRNDDKVGLILFHSHVEKYIPPRKGQKHVLRVVREALAYGQDDLAEASPQPRWPWQRHRTARSATNISTALEFLMKVTKRKTVCFVISDFLAQGYQRAMTMANRKHDVIGVHVSDSRERSLPNVGLIELNDAESGGRGLYDTGSKAFRHAYEKLIGEHRDQLASDFRANGIDLIHVNSADSVADPLIKFFRLRERRMRR